MRLLSALLIGRAALDMAYRALDSVFQQVSVNVLSLIHGLLDLALVAVVVLLGLGMIGVIGALGVSALVMAIVAVGIVVRHLRTLPPDVADAPGWNVMRSRVWKLSAVTFVRDLSLYFATPALQPCPHEDPGRPGTSRDLCYELLRRVLHRHTGGLRLPRSLARVRARHVCPLLCRTAAAFDLMNKVQVLAVIPAGAGLAVMVADYLPLLYGPTFAASVPTARVLVVLLFAETAFAVGLLVIWVDERYRAILATQAVMVAGAPLFVWAATRFGLLSASLVLGGSRLAASLLGYAEAHRLYGVQFPWRFAAKVSARVAAHGSVPGRRAHDLADIAPPGDCLHAAGGRHRRARLEVVPRARSQRVEVDRAHERSW